MTNEEEVIIDPNNEEIEINFDESEDTSDESQAKPEVKPKRSPQEEYEYHKGRADRIAKKLGLEAKQEVKSEKPQKTGELDETQLDYLDLKGISDPDEIDIIQKVVAKTGQTVRQALKDDYVVSKLESIRKENAVKSATPSATKRGGNQVNDIASAIAKFEQTKELPSDFKLREAVVDALVNGSNTNKPSWHK